MRVIISHAICPIFGFKIIFAAYSEKTAIIFTDANLTRLCFMEKRPLNRKI